MSAKSIINTIKHVWALDNETFCFSVTVTVEKDINPIYEAWNIDNAFVDSTNGDEADPGPEDTVTVTITGPGNVWGGNTAPTYTGPRSDPGPVGSFVTLAYSYTTASGDNITEPTKAVIGAMGVTATFTIDT
ncbi:hypothetical protein, partial [Vibrio parahaemolyticus]|uniref:hypothetical protein n=1 Tax=Vibrio parahaemolyticus TaxID=670 RepID=UPI001364BFE2